ncbi:hypothetical protein JCM3770_007039 [Rhodotorula araucariae]
MRPAPGLLASFKEVLSRTAVIESKGGASKLARPALKFQRPIHLPQPGSTARHASSAAHPTSWRAVVDSFVESIYAGTFKAVRSSASVRPGPYSASRLPPRPSGSLARGSATSRPLTSAARARFGPSPHPHAGHSAPRTAHVGLGAARKFSSAGFGVWDNVVHNAPLALRALADQCDGGIDRRKWQRETAGIRRARRTNVKGKGRAPAGWDAMEEKKREFQRFFGVAAAGATVEANTAEPVTLVLAIDPDFELAAPSTSADSSTFRVLSASALDSFASIASAYSAHAHRLRVVLNRLSAAGLLDPEIRASTEVGVAPAGSQQAGRRVWRVVFDDGLVTRSRVERVVRGEEDATRAVDGASEVAPPWAEKVRSWARQSAVAAGEGDWWWLTGGDELSPTASALQASYAPTLDTPALPLSPASASATASTASEAGSSAADAFVFDAAHALAVAETFVFPDPSASALSARSPSSFASDAEDDDIAEQAGWTTWAYDSTPAASVAEESLDPAADAWADSDAGSFWDEGSDGGSVVALGEDEDGVRGFLREVEVELGARGQARW